MNITTTMKNTYTHTENEKCGIWIKSIKYTKLVQTQQFEYAKFSIEIHICFFLFFEVKIKSHIVPETKMDHKH